MEPPTSGTPDAAAGKAAAEGTLLMPDLRRRPTSWACQDMNLE